MAIEQSPRAGLQTERKASGFVIPGQIPQALLSHPQWVCWRYVNRSEGRKPDKQPVNPRNLANAGVHWANTWTSFEEAYVTYLRHFDQHIHGIGFVLTVSDPYVAVDLDACIHDEEIENNAVQIIADLGSYTEISPSGNGIRILLACPEFHDNARQEAIEVYSHSRYVTITGQHVAGTPPAISVTSPDVMASLLPPMPEQGSLVQMKPLVATATFGPGGCLCDRFRRSAARYADVAAPTGDGGARLVWLRTQTHPRAGCAGYPSPTARG